jgi:hypothetical protein
MLGHARGGRMGRMSGVGAGRAEPFPGTAAPEPHVGAAQFAAQVGGQPRFGAESGCLSVSSSANEIGTST